MTSWVVVKNKIKLNLYILNTNAEMYYIFINTIHS